MISTRKERFGWYMYDWANSAFSTTVITVFLGPYLTEIAKSASDASGNISILGFDIFHGSLFAYAVSLSVILQLVILPILGAIADTTNAKKKLLGLFAYIGAFATMGMYFIDSGNFLLGSFLLVIANLSFGASIVMYNAYLNELSEPEKRDSVSSVGWAVGYLGGGIVLALNLALFTNAESFGLSSGMAVRISLCSAGVWWALFTVIPMVLLKARTSQKTISSTIALKNSLKMLANTIKDARNHPQALIFLLAYLFYNDGVQAVLVLSAQFGNQELNFDMGFLTTLILIIQFVAFGGSLVFNIFAKKYGARNSIAFALVLWIMVVFYSFAILSTQMEFLVIGIIIGFIMGGTQSLSRSLYSKVIPIGKEAEYFSLYEVGEKGTSWMGPLLFGLSLQLTHSYRFAILSLILFFIVGFILLLKFNYKKS